jgi:hypothetical protein
VVAGTCRCDAGVQRLVKACAFLGLEIVILDKGEFDLGALG